MPLLFDNLAGNSIYWIKNCYQTIMESKHLNRTLSTAGLLIALGIIYGDIGTSPLYTFQTILTEGELPTDRWYWVRFPVSFGP